MSAELHLPDLPEVPLTLGATSRAPGLRLPWSVRLREALASYLPLLMMMALALLTWWLVESTPPWGPERVKDRSRVEADYAMSRFTLERFAADGSLRVRLDGEELRHFPAGDRIEIDQIAVRALGGGSRVIEARANQGVSDGDARTVRLRGAAELIGRDGEGRSLIVRGEDLVADLARETVRSAQPVELVQGRNVVRAAGLVWNQPAQRLQLLGPVRARLNPVSSGGAP